MGGIRFAQEATKIMAQPEQGSTCLNSAPKGEWGQRGGKVLCDLPEIKCDPIGLPLARLMQYACRALPCIWP